MRCVICNNEIELTRKVGRPRKYCEECFQYIPKSAFSSSKYYQWWQFLITINEEELQILFKKRKEDCKYTKDKQKIKRLRTEMVIINEVYEDIQRRENNSI